MISIKARILEKGLQLIGMRKIASKMILSSQRRNRYELPPKSFYKKYEVRCNVIENRKCITVKRPDGTQRHILYFHGGAYTVEAVKIHWNIVSQLLNNTKCMITFINYPLSPEYTCRDIINTVMKIYAILCKQASYKTILAGDSAGGGLALALAQQIKKKGVLPEPEKIVLFSPWLDVSMPEEIPDELQKRDLFLDRETLRIAGKRYAGSFDTKNPICSPLYGDLNDIGDIALFTGTNEVLNLQARRLRERCEKICYFEYEGMQHVWVGFPISEAGNALDRAASFIEGRFKS